MQAEHAKARAEEQAKEEKEYLRRHNKKGAKVLSQVAKTLRAEETSGEEGSEEDKEESESEE